MATEMFLKFEDYAIEGESVTPGHEREIDVSSFHWTVNNSVCMQEDIGFGRANVRNIVLNKSTCRATPKLWKAIVEGSRFKGATIFVRKAAGNDPLNYLVIVMTDLSVVRQEFNGDSDGIVAESFELSFSEVEIIYQQQKDDGTKEGGEIAANYNIQTNATC